MNSHKPRNSARYPLLLLPILALFAIAAIACGGDSPTATPQPTATQPSGQQPTTTAQPTATQGAVQPTATQPAAELRGTITISGAFALYPLVIKWSEEFQKIHPNVQFDITGGGAGKGMTDVLGGLVDLAMFSREALPNELAGGAVLAPVAIDAVIPTTSASNPVRADILSKGIRRDEFAAIFIDETITDWKQIFPDTQASGNTEIQVYGRSDSAGAAEVWAAYIKPGSLQPDLKGILVNADPGLAEAVRRHPGGSSIGFNNVGYSYDPNTLEQLQGLLVIPIDLNGNGVLDPDESFYQTRDQVTRAIADGIYPSPPARELTLVAKNEFTGLAKEFVLWILTDGQAYVSEAGFVHVSQARIDHGLQVVRGQ